MFVFFSFLLSCRGVLWGLIPYNLLLDSMTYRSFAVSLQTHRHIISSFSLIVYCCYSFYVSSSVMCCKKIHLIDWLICFSRVTVSTSLWRLCWISLGFCSFSIFHLLLVEKKSCNPFHFILLCNEFTRTFGERFIFICYTISFLWMRASCFDKNKAN